MTKNNNKKSNINVNFSLSRGISDWQARFICSSDVYFTRINIFFSFEQQYSWQYYAKQIPGSAKRMTQFYEIWRQSLIHARLIFVIICFVRKSPYGSVPLLQAEKLAKYGETTVAWKNVFRGERL